MSFKVYINFRAFHDESNDTGGGSIFNICGALLAGRGPIIAERLKRPWPRLNDKPIFIREIMRHFDKS
jgi:hypothetical protein